ncbi:MAG: hypothetical protein BMS9Abin31_0511 [Gammaproteobacteria bacterium]|nr:MAG: hypothetical protein BMS9Abin31_0511 [Gammaproteobacteria bacterium]
MNKNIELIIKDIYEIKQEAIEESNAHFQKKIQLIDYISASLGALSLATLSNTEKVNEVLSKDYPAKDGWFSKQLINVINTMLCIKDLCITGFDTQARALVRILDERIYQTLILLSSAEDYKEWGNTEDSKKTHHALFREKKILKKMMELEKKYFSLSASAVEYFRELRKNYIKYYSECVHGASDSIFIGAYAYPFGDIDDGPFITALFGRSSSCSHQTLHHVIGQMAYFSEMLNAILIDLHSIQDVNNNEDIDTYCTSQSKIRQFSKELLLVDSKSKSVKS